MKKLKFTESQITQALKEHEAGKNVPDICRELKINRATFYNWKKRYSGMDADLEYLLTHSYKDQMIAGMAANPPLFDEAIRLALSDKQPYAWRASWLLWSCMEPNDTRLRKYIPEIIRFLPVCRDNQQGELLKILYLLEIDEEYEGILFDLCVGIWEKLNKQPSAKYDAFKMIVKTAKKYPELHREIEYLTEPQYTETLTSAVKKGIFRILSELH